MSCSEVWTQESMQLRTVCHKRLYVVRTHNIREFWDQNFYRHSTNFFLFCNNVSIIQDKIFATDFLRFFTVISKKNVKSHVFLKSEKNEKYVFSNIVAIIALLFYIIVMNWWISGLVHPSIHIRLLTKLGKTQGCVQMWIEWSDKTMIKKLKS